MIFLLRANARLRGEQRNDQLTAQHRKPQKSTHYKNAARCESLLNRLLYFRSQP